MTGLVVLYVLALLGCSVLFDVPDLIHVVEIYTFLRHPNLQVGGKTSPVSFSREFHFSMKRPNNSCQSNSHKHVINSLPGWSKTLCAMPKRIRRQRPECGISVDF